jgi:hypothetical protein
VTHQLLQQVAMGRRSYAAMDRIYDAHFRPNASVYMMKFIIKLVVVTHYDKHIFVTYKNTDPDCSKLIRLNSMKSSRAISRAMCLYETDVSRTISVIIIIIIRDDDRKVDFIQTSDVADSPRRLHGI